MTQPWIEDARRLLIDRHHARSGWGYSPESAAYVEPTALAAMALLALGLDQSSTAAARSAARWLAKIQQPDGSLGISAELDVPRWGTAWAILLWRAAGGWQAECDAAAQWLLKTVGKKLPRQPVALLGHDPSISGWPWVEGTHSWLEPTVLSVLALRCLGRDHNDRVRDGLRLIRDRALNAGGWNYGNKSSFGHELRPEPAPTGLAILALTGTGEGEALIERGCRYLQESLPRIRAPRSLAWGLLGLTAVGRRPEVADAWLEESFLHAVRGTIRSDETALLLLAAESRSLELLGIAAHEEAAS